MEIIPKAKKRAPEWYNLGFYAASALLTAIILGYGVLFYFESRTLDNLQDLEDKIAQVGVKEEKATEAKVLIAKKRVDDFSKLLKEHKKPSNFFSFLETVSHPKVWFTQIALNPEKAEAAVSGQTSSFQTLGEQLFIFRNQEAIEKVELTSLSIGKTGETEFSINISLNQQIFK